MSAKPYILGQVIARGGMAEVFRGLHVGQDGFKRPIAIKKILPHHAQNAEFTGMFKDEALIGQRLQHANIVKVEGFDLIDGSASIIMEFVDGSDLRSILSAAENKKSSQGGRYLIPPDLCAYVIAEAARGLHYAHTRCDSATGKPLNIVHRDISPQNLLISWDGEVKVTDFGIAAADRDLKFTETRAGIVKGKYSYMSPEQISGKKCDGRSDIFALCVVLWEMLALRRLFTADNEVDIIEMVRDCKIPVRLRDLNPNVSEELEIIVMRGLVKDLGRRYESMDLFEKSLRTYLNKQAHPVTGHDLAEFVKTLLDGKFQKSQDEMRKILTMVTNTPAPKSTGPRQSLVLDMDQADKTATLTLGRSRSSNTMTSHPSDAMSHPRGHAPRGVSLSTRRSHESRSHNSLKNSAKNTAKKPLISASSLVWMCATAIIIIGGAFALRTYRSAAKQALSLTVRSSPQIVQISINDREHAGGRYVMTPARIKLDPGLNYVAFSRPGYKSERLLINTDKGAPKSPPTVRLSAVNQFAPVRLELKGPGPIIVSVNDGFFRQQLTATQSVAMIDDITSGVDSVVTISDADKNPLFDCRFRPQRTSPTRPLIIIIDTTKRTCQLSAPNLRGSK
jgi:serine/threonine protein kinase